MELINHPQFNDNDVVTVGTLKLILNQAFSTALNPIYEILKAMDVRLTNLENRMDKSELIFGSFMEEWATNNLEYVERFDHLEKKLIRIESTMITQDELNSSFGSLNTQLKEYIDVKVKVVRSELIPPLIKEDEKIDTLADSVYENRGLTESQHLIIKKFPVFKHRPQQPKAP